jgi:hypothetical protein
MSVEAENPFIVGGGFVAAPTVNAQAPTHKANNLVFMLICLLSD